jgi:signal transduction histidine kinase
MPDHHRVLHDQYLRNYHEGGPARIIGIGRDEKGRRKDGSIFHMRLAVNAVNINGKRFYAGIIQDKTHLRAAEEEIERMNQELERKVIQRTLELEEKNNQLIQINTTLNREIKERQQIESILRDNERELQHALEKEKELNELKSRFVSMASHEFRTPLSTIQSSAGLISRYPLSDQQQQRSRHIERIKSSVNMLTGILDDFLSLAKLEEGRISMTPETFTFDELVTEVLDDLRTTLKPGQKTIHESKTTNIQLVQDRSLLKHVLYNLLSNATKYSPENRSIFLRTTMSGPLFQFEIEDQGIGIPIQDQAHLFTRFFRAKNAINIQGTGLGLNIVRQYINLMGGEIQFSSVEGKGSCFTIRIPISAEIPTS